MTLSIGDRVRLNFYPYCEGRIIEVQKPLIVCGAVFSPERYRCRWDESYGVSGLLSASDLESIQDE